MRMWLADPEIMCRSHLLGEHNELHKHKHCFIKRQKMDGRQGQIEPEQMGIRHDEIANEMVARGYKHESPYEMPDVTNYTHLKVNRKKALSDLLARCDECRQNYNDKYGV